MKEVYVVNCCRTAVGSFGGSLKDTPATELGAVVVKEALNRAGVKPEQVDELMFGCVLTAALGQNPARQVGVKAGLPYSVPAYTVGMVCGSGMKSVISSSFTFTFSSSSITLISCFSQICLPVGISPAINFLPMMRSISRSFPFSRRLMIAMEVPVFPARPVRPLRCV